MVERMLRDPEIRTRRQKSRLEAIRRMATAIGAWQTALKENKG